MREPFVRPFFAWFFYVLAALGGALATLLLVAEFFGTYRILGSKWATYLATWGVLGLICLWASALSLAAVGYIIEKLAKIEWNTRPDGLAGQGYGSSSTSFSAPVARDRQYYYIDRGPLVGPLSGPDLLQQIKDGKLTIAARYFVEENGQRRPLANLSEINL